MNVRPRPRSGVLVLVALSGILVSAPVFADVPPAPPPDVAEPCTVVRACSAEGVDCDSADRTCQDQAIARGLEVTCERPDVPSRHFVYCPPGAGSRDSRFVWALLMMAMTIAIGGSIIAFALLKKKP